jgi:hypothetical protein
MTDRVFASVAHGRRGILSQILKTATEFMLRLHPHFSQALNIMWFLSPLTMLPLLAYTRFAWSTVTIDPFTYTLTADPASTSTDAEAVAATPTSVDPSIVSNKTAPVETQSVVETSESPEYTGTATAIPTTLPAANASATFAPAFAPSDTAAVEDQDYEDVLGTNRNAPSAGEGQLIGFNFVSDAKQKMGDRTALPKLLIQKANVCHYDWARIKTPPSFTVFRDESLSVDDVSQGGVGDCGLGASVIAITASKRTKYLRRLTSECSQSILPFDSYTRRLN